MAWITIDGERYKLPSPEDMTLDELCQAEDMGASIPTETRPASMRWVKALVLIAKQRNGEVVNVEALGGLTFGQLEFEEEPNGGPPANRAARRANGKSGSRATTPANSGT